MNAIHNAVSDFSHCHEGIAQQLDALARVPDWVQQAMAAQQEAQRMLTFFDDVVLAHHSQEENDLFPAVMQWAQVGQESLTVRKMVDQLTEQHRAIEALWAKLAPMLKKVVKGQFERLDAQCLQSLIERYRAHAAFEEQHFLPLAEQILWRDAAHMAGLGMALHMREVRAPVPFI